jgi:hypothetical protein
MRTTCLTTVAALVGTLAIATVVRAQAPEPPSASPLQAGIALYASASYDEALAAFDAARQIDLALEDRVTLDQHRMLCLLALGRTSAADEAAASLLETKPDFLLTASDASPRVRAMFDQTRRRVLPAVVRRVYTDAKRAFDAGELTSARDGFAQLSHLLSDPQVAAADPALADLGTLTEGFLQLSAAGLERQAARRDLDTVQAALAVLQPTTTSMPMTTPLGVAMSAPALAVPPAVEHPAADPPSAAASSLATSPAPAAPHPSGTAFVPAPFAPLGIFTYDWRDKDVVPPVAVTQSVSGWWGAMGEPAAGTPLGAIDVVVDETGRVVDARIHQSANRVYDAVLLESVKQWRYRPATKDGRPVKYRRVTGVVSGR